MLRPGLPLHEQLSSWLRERIESGELAPEERLPSENDLCRRFDVSRVTVRRALQTLEADGLVYRLPGVGSFVQERQVAQGLVRLTDFAQDMAQAGLTASSRILRQVTEPCPAVVSDWLALPPGAPVLRLDRLRLGNGEPIALDRTWLPPAYAQLLDGHDLTSDTIYRILEREYDVPALSGRYRIAAASADGEVATALAVPCGDPLLLIERISRTVGGRPIYFQRRFYRSDRVAYELEVAREPGQPRSRDEADPGMPLREFEAVFQRPSPPASADPAVRPPASSDDRPASDS